MSLHQILSLCVILAGAVFFLAATVGLLRFPDVFTRLHALTKADNVGLGLLAAGLALQASSWTVALKMALIWVLVSLASATVSHLIAQGALRAGIQPWRSDERQ